MKTCEWCFEDTEETKTIILPSGGQLEVCSTGSCAENAIYAEQENLEEKYDTRYER